MITTKLGDEGQTSLWNGERLGKDHIRIECLGDLDELNSFLGLSKNFAKNENQYEMLEHIQKKLFTVASLVAKMDKGEEIDAQDINVLEDTCQELLKDITISGFELPGATIFSAYVHVCRTIARRVERRLVKLAKEEELDGRLIVYLNRLSDFLFALAAYCDHHPGEGT